jgi:choline dehydrogenase-like flavoprotein
MTLPFHCISLGLSSQSGFVGGPAPAGLNFFTIDVGVISPTARRWLLYPFNFVFLTSRSGGQVSLASSDPFVQPLINPNLLGTTLDTQIMVRALKRARYFVENSPAWNGYIISEFGDFANATTDGQLQEFAKENAGTVSP